MMCSSVLVSSMWLWTLIVAGMMLIRSDSGQLMLVSQQALAQAQQSPRVVSSQAPRILGPQVSVCVCTLFLFSWILKGKNLVEVLLWSYPAVISGVQVTAAAGSKSNEKVTVLRMAAPPSFQPAPVQKTAVVKVHSPVGHKPFCRSTDLAWQFPQLADKLQGYGWMSLRNTVKYTYQCLSLVPLPEWYFFLYQFYKIYLKQKTVSQQYNDDVSDMLIHMWDHSGGFSL